MHSKQLVYSGTLSTLQHSILSVIFATYYDLCSFKHSASWYMGSKLDMIWEERDGIKVGSHKERHAGGEGETKEGTTRGGGKVKTRKENGRRRVRLNNGKTGEDRTK